MSCPAKGLHHPLLGRGWQRIARAARLILRPLLDRLGMTPIELVTLQAATTAVKRAEDGIVLDSVSLLEFPTADGSAKVEPKAATGTEKK